MVKDSGRAEGISRDLVAALVLFAVAMLLGLSRCASQQPVATSSPAPSTTPSRVAVPVQPDQHGYTYLLSRERYVVRQSDDTTPEIQTRLRHSWSATTDGWTWASQTGSDPAHFVFAPDTEYLTIREAPPDPIAIATALRSWIRAIDEAGGFPPATPTELDDRIFQFIYGEMAFGYHPYLALPEDYRQALVDLLAGLDGAARTAGVTDPEGRAATRVTYLNPQARPGWSQSLYFDADDQFLAYTYVLEGTEQKGEHIVVDRRIVTTIPDDVLAVLGSDRIARVIWH